MRRRGYGCDQQRHGCSNSEAASRRQRSLKRTRTKTPEDVEFVAGMRAPQPARRDALGTSYPNLETVDSSTARSAFLSRCTLLRHSSFVRAVCVNALVRDLRGGRSAMVVPTATVTVSAASSRAFGRRGPEVTFRELSRGQLISHGHTESADSQDAAFTQELVDVLCIVGPPPPVRKGGRARRIVTQLTHVSCTIEQS
jgi:hypothetical protein